MQKHRLDLWYAMKNCVWVRAAASRGSATATAARHPLAATSTRIKAAGAVVDCHGAAAWPITARV